MLSLPKIEDRPAQPYVAIRRRLTMDQFGEITPQTFDALAEWIDKKGIEVTGPSFFKYTLIDMPRLEVEFAFPIATQPEGDEQVVTGTVPAGRYASITHRGPYEELYDANAVLIGWSKERQLDFDATETPEGQRFASRLEIYEIDDRTEDDPQNWQTTVAIKLRDA